MRSMKLDEYVDLEIRLHVSPFLDLAPYCRVMPLFDDLKDFSAIFAPNFVKFDPWIWRKNRSDDTFSSFFQKGFRV